MMSVYSGIVQRLTPVIVDILDKIIRRVLAGILGKITGEKASPTPTSNAHDIIHLLITELEIKQHFREYIYINTQRIFDIISLVINKIFIIILIIIIGAFIILLIYFPQILGTIPQEYSSPALTAQNNTSKAP